MYAIGKFSNTLPLIYEKGKFKDVDEYGELKLHKACSFVIVNPKKDNLLECVPYAFTLLPFREDMIIGNGDIVAYPDLYDPSTEDPWSADAFALEGDISAEAVALRFFATAGNKLSPVMAAWLRRPEVKEMWRLFRGGQIASTEKAMEGHPVVALLNKIQSKED